VAEAASDDEALDITVVCQECARPAARVQLIPPGDEPADAPGWTPGVQGVYRQFHDPKPWRLIYNGVEAGNGLGDDIDSGRAQVVRVAFAAPLAFTTVHTAGLYDDAGFCAACEKAYCFSHWNRARAVAGTCPQGHWKSLDPHWTPGVD
jgi:hypothetical protein